MKRLPHHSQHFLRNPQLVKLLLKRTTINKEDIVYDIGAGSGVITSVLASVAKKIIAIEYDQKTAEKLQQNVAKYSNVTVRQADFLTEALPKGPYKIFANIPFHISSRIVRKITTSDNPPEATYLIVQKQFAYKLVPQKDGFTGQLGAMIAPWFEVRVRKRLQRTDFWPHPNVDTAFIEVIPREVPFLLPTDRSHFYRMIEECYDDPKKFAKTPRKTAGISTDLRPSQLTPEQWVALYTTRK